MKHGTNYRLHLRIVFVLVAFVLVFVSSDGNATIYHFSTSGNDSYKGSVDSPKKNIGTALGLMGSGNIIRFKRGDQWYLPLTSLDLRNKSNFTIEAWGSGTDPVPIIAGMTILPNSGTNSWAYDGLGRWRCLIPVTCTAVFRVVANGVTKLNIADKKNPDNTKDSLISPNHFFFDAANNQIYLYTGSSTIKPQYVEVIPASASLPAGISTVWIQNTYNVTIKDINFRGGALRSVIAINPPSRNITIQGCTIERASAYGSGILVGSATATTQFVSMINIIDNMIDKSFSTAENNITDVLSGDGIFCLNAVDTAVLRDNTITNWGHNGISLTAYAAAYPNTRGVHNVIVDRNDISAGSSGYMHAIDVSGLPNLVTQNIIKRNNCHDYSASSHLQGSYNFFFSNIFTAVIDTRQGNGQTELGHAADVSPWRRTEGIMEARNNWIIHNVFANSERANLLVSWYDGDSILMHNSNVTDNVIANNIMYNPGDKPYVNVAMGLWVDSAAAGINYYRRNNLLDTDTTADIVRFKKWPYGSASEFNTTLGCNTACSGNSQSSPGFTNQTNPLSSTYFALGNSVIADLRTGGIDYRTNPGFTINISEFVDYLGVPWRVGNPSRGAVQK